jgi:hypothetical protein
MKFIDFWISLRQAKLVDYNTLFSKDSKTGDYILTTEGEITVNYCTEKIKLLVGYVCLDEDKEGQYLDFHPFNSELTYRVRKDILTIRTKHDGVEDFNIKNLWVSLFKLIRIEFY